MERVEAEAIYDAGREACIAFLLDFSSRFERESARLQERMARVEEQARQSSRTSSKPPSSDPPKTRQQRRAEARAKAKELAKGQVKRQAGAQTGHRGSGRKLLPEDRIDEIVDHYPEQCAGCGHEFTEAEKAPSNRPGRHQVAELPRTTVFYTEHRCHRLRCPGCAKRTAGALPGEVAGSAFGPDLQAAIVTMTARNRLSRRDMAELAGELFQIGISVGTVDATTPECQIVGAAA